MISWGYGQTPRQHQAPSRRSSSSVLKTVVNKMVVFCIMAHFMLYIYIYIGTHSIGTCASLFQSCIKRLLPLKFLGPELWPPTHCLGSASRMFQHLAAEPISAPNVAITVAGATRCVSSTSAPSTALRIASLIPACSSSYWPLDLHVWEMPGGIKTGGAEVAIPLHYTFLDLFPFLWISHNLTIADKIVHKKWVGLPTIDGHLVGKMMF